MLLKMASLFHKTFNRGQRLGFIKGGGGGENTILRYELAMMARTCTNSLRVFLSHRYNIVHVRPWSKNGA